ncbi:MAG: endonuclease [Sediminimonas qiaohouensis]|uniref:Endonuclease n=1 Tax=Sediminimonas qiaohouensis TaxID=552061 RepID=A0A7C9HCX8_9RHOB|nr:endonuclease/exonuclease/phosphatase family protein [Sediminimonas qiaohouensis]MTJ05685.1 endonuclease [Sediminimonas qiaohouensis]
MKAATLRIATYNLQKCVGLDLRRRPDRSLEVIEALGAQIVVLQEADKRLPPRPAALPAFMAEDAGWRVVPVGGPGGSLGWHGNAMLLRPGIGVEVTDGIELPGFEPRGAIRADLDTPLGPLRVIGLHLGLRRRDRLRQIAAIERALHHLPPRPTVLAGDFNAWGRAAALDATAHSVRFIPGPASYPAPRPVAALDRFALSPHLHAARVGSTRAQPARVASDHLPVWADLELSSQGAEPEWQPSDTNCRDVEA